MSREDILRWLGANPGWHKTVVIARGLGKRRYQIGENLRAGVVGMKTKKTGWPGLSGLAAAHRWSPVDHDTSSLASGERGVLSIACR